MIEGRGMKAAFHTLGCKVNFYETRAVIEDFQALGFEITDFTRQADVYVVNTCSVTGTAEHKSRQMIHRARRKNPKAVIVACGCYVQRDGKSVSGGTGADLVFGNNKKSLIAAEVLKFIEEKRTEVSVEVEDLTDCRRYENQRISSMGKNIRAYVKIQDGCDRFCSYCIIPYVRGRSRCRSFKDVLAEVSTLAKNSYKEVVLTGIDISMYEDLIGLIEMINAVEGIERIRLGSLEVSLVTEEFVKRLAACEKACAHFHLSLQSGCDATLKRMNRRYNLEEYRKAADLLRNVFRNCAITTDIIVGFPGETEEEFAQTVDFVREMAFARIHVFKYSEREGTAAARMKNKVPERIKGKRSARLISLAEDIKRDWEGALIGGCVTVLTEEQTDLEGRKIFKGYTPEYVKVAFTGSACINETVVVKVTSRTVLKGEQILFGERL
ncbi:MAG: tRNA (N(6)-L-threonylcarbamoyladenosine(37)-C(2))-methylthiotransferase MtaB [Lachnospiraceae bacterium]|jgi:threonylcarbamoyladenosine tRNA methylthiotransferase MtaB